jgi:hypothetical protein
MSDIEPKFKPGDIVKLNNDPEIVDKLSPDWKRAVKAGLSKGEIAEIIRGAHIHVINTVGYVYDINTSGYLFPESLMTLVKRKKLSIHE